MAKVKTHRWDAAEYLETEEDMAAYLEAALEDGNPQLIAAALGDIARARGMSKMARDTGLGRESLYKALSPDGNPEFATVLKVVRALGLQLHASPQSAHARGMMRIASQHSQHSQLPVFRPEIRHRSHLTPPVELPASAVPPPRALNHASGKAQHAPALHRRGVVLAAVRLKAQCPRMPTLRPNAAFAFDGDLPVRPGKIKLPPAHRIKAILPLRLRQLCHAHPQRKLRFQYAHRLPLAAPVGNVQPALLAQEFDRHERVSPWQLRFSWQAGGFGRHLCAQAAFRFVCAAGTGTGHLHSGRIHVDTLRKKYDSHRNDPRICLPSGAGKPLSGVARQCHERGHRRRRQEKDYRRHLPCAQQCRARQCGLSHDGQRDGILIQPLYREATALVKPVSTLCWQRKRIEPSAPRYGLFPNISVCLGERRGKKAISNSRERNVPAPALTQAHPQQRSHAMGSAKKRIESGW